MVRRCALTLALISALLSAQSAVDSSALISDAVSTSFNGRSVTDVRMEGTVITHFGVDDEGTFIFEATKTGRSKMSMNLVKLTRTETKTGVDEAAACWWSDSDGRTSDSSTHNCWSPGNWLFPILTFAEHKTNLSIGRSEKSNTVVFAVNLQSKSSKTTNTVARLSRAEIEFDPATRLPLALRYNTHPEDDYSTDIPVEVTFSKYQPFEGVQLPTHIVKTMNGSTVLELSVTAVSFNTGTKAQ
jgi:hypothetical protein